MTRKAHSREAVVCEVHRQQLRQIAEVSWKCSVKLIVAQRQCLQPSR